MPVSITNPGIHRLRVAGIADASGVVAEPRDVLVDVRPGEINLLAIGTPEQVNRHESTRCAQLVDLPNQLLLPGFVNAHTHLDLTHLGPIAHDPADGFETWVAKISSVRATNPEAIADSVQLGVDLCLAGGTVAVADIAGPIKGEPTLVPARVLRASPLVGVSFVEHFGIGHIEVPWLKRIAHLLAEHKSEVCDRSGGVRIGLQPHAPYSTSLRSCRRALEHAQKLDLPLATHLAESLDERRLVEKGVGPLREFAERGGFWSDDMAEELGNGLRPIEYFADVLGASDRRWLLSHVADANDDEVQTLARARASVAYCPRAADYFDAPGALGPHRYKDMLAAGVNVCIGTDSIACLPASAADPGHGISILDELRLLHRRDETDPVMLIGMGTLNGASALGLREGGFLIQPGATPLGLNVVTIPDGDGDPLGRVLGGDEPVEPVCVAAAVR